MKQIRFLAMTAMVAVTTMGTGLMMSSCNKENNAEPVIDPVVDPVVTPEKNEWKPITLTRAQQEMVQANNEFAFNLFRAVALPRPAGPCDGKPQSIILSPISITYALGMLNNGATGETAKQINDVLGFADTGADGINAFCRKMLTEAPALDKLTKVMIANTIYMNKPYQLKPMFVELAKQYYDAEPETRDFHDGQTCKVINKWCNDHTNGMIPEVLSEDAFNPDAVSYLLNAIYFKGTWSQKFDKANTKDETFTGEDGSQRQLPMMHMTDHQFNYAKTELFEMLRLPYGNGAYAMNILLPAEGKTLIDVMRGLNNETWRQYRFGNPAIADVKLPRFESNTDQNLVSIMSDLGMPKAFTDKAEFPNFCNVPTYIGLMKQVARIKLDEEGSEAAAVTVIGLETASFEPHEPPHVTFHATRPFLYIISEQSTGAIFFMGQYVGE